MKWLSTIGEQTIDGQEVYFDYKGVQIQSGDFRSGVDHIAVQDQTFLLRPQLCSSAKKKSLKPALLAVHILKRPNLTSRTMSLNLQEHEIDKILLF